MKSEKKMTQTFKSFTEKLILLDFKDIHLFLETQRKRVHMNKKLLITLSLVAGIMLFQDVQAQNYAKKFGIEGFGGLVEYGGDRGSTYFISRKPNYQGGGAAFGYYVNPSFDAVASFMTGDMGIRDWSFPEKFGFTARVTNIQLGLRYKLNNNYILSEDSRIRPYLQGAWGGFQSVSRVIHDVPGYGENRSQWAAQWSAGAGIKFAINDQWDVFLQSTYNYTYDDNMDGSPFSMSRIKLRGMHDAYFFQALGIGFNFGENEGSYRFSKDENQVPEEVKAAVNLAAKSIQFKTDSDELLTESFAKLDTIVRYLKDYPELDALIEGHTDNTGDDAYNSELSQKRADAVKKYLTDKGIDPTRLTPKGYGGTQPIADNSTPQGRAMNRRVEVKLYYSK